MASGFALTGLLIFLVAFGFAAWAWITFMHSRRRVWDSDDIVLNFMSFKNDRRFLGSLVDKITSLPGRQMVTYRPKGLDLRSKKFTPEEIEKKMQEQTAIVEPLKICSVPKGIIEADKAVHFLLPKHASDLPEEFQKTEMGLALMYATEFANDKRALIKMLEEGQLRREDALLKIGDGELSREWMAQMNEKMQDALKAVVNDSTKRNSPQIFNAQRGGSPQFDRT